MNPAQVNRETSQAAQQGQQLQNQYNQQAGQLQGQYGNAQNQANQAYQNLSNYNTSMQNPADMYKQALTSAQTQYGFNPASIAQSAKNLTALQNQVSNLPQAAQQMSNYSGATAGQTAGLYSNLLGNMQPGLTNANNSLTNMMGLLGATQNQANQQATLGLGGEQLKSQNYQALYSQSVSQMQTAGQTMAAIEQLQQQQGSLTAQQIASYRNAYSQYTSAQAAQTQAAAAMKTATAQSSQINQQVSMANTLSQSLSKLYGGKPQQYAQSLLQMLTGNSNVTLPNMPGGGGGGVNMQAARTSGGVSGGGW